MTSYARALPLLALLMLGACGVGGSIETNTSAGGTSSTTSASSSSSGNGGASSSTASSSTVSGTSSSASSSSGGTPMAKGCVTDVSAGHHVFPCQGINYDVEIPPMCAAGGCGLVLDMHGLSMNATEEDAGTGMRARGTQHGYVVVQPTAPGIVPSWDQASHAPLVFAFVTDVAAALLTDPKRAHALGFSQGGGMTWRMICAHADFFASAAPLSGLPGCEWAAPNAPSREVPTLQVHGHKDSVLNFATYAIPERDAALAFWKDGAGAVIEMDATHKATRYLTAAGTPLEFWEHDYAAPNALFAGHCFPGGTDVGPGFTQFGCADMNTFVVGQIAMDFFIAHPMP